jgi:hypothetical protein
MLDLSGIGMSRPRRAKTIKETTAPTMDERTIMVGSVSNAIPGIDD